MRTTMDDKKATAWLGAMAAVALGAATYACSDSGTVHETVVVDAGASSVGNDAGAGANDGGVPPDGASPDCVANPTTHLEIINACTDAAAFDKSPVLPLLLADGGLPPLP